MKNPSPPPATKTFKTIDEKTARGNLAAFSSGLPAGKAGSFFNDLGESMYSPYLTYFALMLGVTPLQFGFIEGFAEAVNRILRLFTGALSDRIGRKVPVVVGYTLIALSRLGLALVRTWGGFIPMRGLRQIGRSMRDPPRAASIAESLPVQEGSKAWSSLNNVYTFGMILGPLLGLLILSLATYGRFVWKVPTQGVGINSFIWLFMWASVPTVISAWIIWLFLTETHSPLKPTQDKPMKTSSQKGSFLQPFRSRLGGIKSYFSNRPLFYITLSHMVLALGAVPVYMIMLYAYKELGASLGEGAIIFLAYVSIHFLASHSSAGRTGERRASLAGFLVDRLGRYLSQVIGNVICAVALFLVVLVNQPLLVIIPMVLYGIFEPLWIATRRAMISDLVPTQNVGKSNQTISTFSILYGIPSVLSPILLGILWQGISARFAFIVAALICAVAIFVLNSAQKFLPPQKT